MSGDADRFAAEYRDLRRQEGWVGADGREDPAQGGDRWKARLAGMRVAANAFARLPGKPLIVDVGAGGGWAVRFLPHARVVGVDLVHPGATEALFVRADMRRLPLRDAAADGLLYAASLHYVPAGAAVLEAARVLRPGGLLVALDSPLYKHRGDQVRAAARSAAYYEAAGHPRLAAHYFPIDATDLRGELAAAGFALERMTAPPRWRRRLLPGPASLVVARKLR